MTLTLKWEDVIGILTTLVALTALGIAVASFVSAQQELDHAHRVMTRIHAQGVAECRKTKQEARRQGLIWISEPRNCNNVQP